MGCSANSCWHRFCSPETNFGCGPAAPILRSVTVQLYLEPVQNYLGDRQAVHFFFSSRSPASVERSGSSRSMLLFEKPAKVNLAQDSEHALRSHRFSNRSWSAHFWAQLPRRDLYTTHQSNYHLRWRLFIPTNSCIVKSQPHLREGVSVLAHITGGSSAQLSAGFSDERSNRSPRCLIFRVRCAAGFKFTQRSHGTRLNRDGVVRGVVLVHA